MLKLVVLLTLFSSISFAQIAYNTDACYGAAVTVAANKIAKDSNRKGSVLNQIGFVAEYCEYNSQYQSIECFDKKGRVDFEAVFESSEFKKKYNGLNEMTYLFATGTQGVDVYYNLKFVKPETSHTCTYIKTTVWTEGYEEMSHSMQKGDKTREEVQLCVSTCLATYDQPGAELKACIARCSK